MSRRPAAACMAVAMVMALPAAPAHAQGRSGAETQEERIFAEAEALFDAGKYAEAAQLYDRAIALNPTRAATFVKRATIHFRDRQYQRATDLLLRAERLAPDDLGLKTVLGLCLYQGGQRARGLRYLEDVTKARPESYEAQLQIGQHYSQTDPDRAIAALERYFRYRPPGDEQRALDAAARLWLGTAYLLKGRVGDAHQALSEALSARPRDPQTRLTLGAVELARGEFARAAALHEPFIPEIPRRPRVAHNLAVAYLRLGRRADAARLSAQYARLVPADPRGHILLGDVALAGGKEQDVRAALSHYEEAQRLARERSAGLTLSVEARIARAHLVQREPERAFAVLEPALDALRAQGGAASASHEAQLLASLLEAELVSHQLGAAPRPSGTANAARLAQLAPGDAGALALCGSVFLMNGSLEQARKYYADALALDRRLPRARAGMAHTLQRLALAALEESADGLATAIQLVEQAAPLDDSPTAVKNLAVLYLMQGRPADALRTLQPALQGSAGGDLALRRLNARTLLMLARYKQAVEEYERTLAEAQRQLALAGDPDRTALSALIAELRTELGGRYLVSGRASEAIVLLERAGREIAVLPREDASAALRRTITRNLSLAYLVRGQRRLGDYEAQLAQSAPQPARAVEALEDVLHAIELGGLKEGKREGGAALCTAALLSTHAGRYTRARDLVARAQAEGGCDLAPPLDALGLDLLLAYISYRDTTNVNQRERSLRLLGKLAGRAAGQAALQELLRDLLRSANQLLAYDYYAAGKAQRAVQLLRAALRVPPSRGKDRPADDSVLAHNLAVAELSLSPRATERSLERLGGRPPEALVNLGILREQRGETRKALELYRKALERGARTPKLREWIDVKERLLSPGGEP